MPMKISSISGVVFAFFVICISHAHAATYTYEALIKSFDTPSELGGLEYRQTVAGPAINNRLEAIGTASLLPRAPDGVGFRLLSYDGSQFSTPVSSGTPVPGVPDATIDLVPTAPIISQNGDILFLSALSGSGAGFPADDALFRLRGGVLETLVRGGDVIDGVEIGPFSITQTFGSISTTGQVAFQATFDDGVSNKTGIFREEAGGFSLVLQQGDPVAGTGGATIGSVGRVDIAADGAVYFSAVYFGPTGSNEGPAVFREKDGEITVVLEPGQVVDGAQLENFLSEVTDVNGSGDFVVRADAGRGDLIKSVDGTLSAVILEGGIAPGIDDPLGFFSNAAINASGDVAFFATNRDNAACNVIVECGIFAEMDGELGLVAKRGDTIEIAPGDFRTISGFGISPRGGFINDLGQVAFLAFFNGPDNPGLGDTQAWIIASPDGAAAVPLPPSLVMLLAAVAGLGMVRTAGRRS